MKLTMYIGQVNHGIINEHDHKVACFLQVYSKHSDKLLNETPESAWQIDETCRERLPAPWNEIVFHHILACISVRDQDFLKAYSEQTETVSIFQREFANLTNWPLETFYLLNGDLRRLAVQADKQLQQNGEKPSKLEDCARMLNKSFTLCATDRSPQNVSKKWGTYNIVSILFRTYFKLKSHNLCKNILRAVKAADLPELDQFPMSHQVTMRYYTGVLSFFNEDFKKAEPDLQFAFDHTPKRFHNNRRLILHYLIPTKLLHGSLPSARHLEEFPELSTLYQPLVTAIKTGNVKQFDEALVSGGTRLIALGTYLTVEQSRGVAVRTLFKKVYVYTSMDRSNKLEISLFKTALQFVGVTVDEDEVECMLANMIHKGYIRGYISHEKRVLVLSQKDPFPGLELQL
ncbi:COP9 signalosome (CSN) subunit [Modicella reniformis]|uniref:Protein CSN12 homolog n=1 Tax=Modicella reniformis TaxID=1440133 RepID=A0A9P6M8V9_9FUNG|nr:COP9 signalosome (CSN) subunit [Modicella reniformis]